MIFNYDMLLSSIDNLYSGEKLENKITHFCRESAVKVYRFKRALENRAYFMSDEIKRMTNVLGIKKEEIGTYFFNYK